MAAPYVCVSCRRELHRRASCLFTPQWSPKASFISLANVVPPAEEQQQTDRTEPKSHKSTPRYGKGNGATSSRNPRQLDPRWEELFLSNGPSSEPGRYSRYAQPSRSEFIAKEETAVLGQNLRNLQPHKAPREQVDKHLNSLTSKDNFTKSKEERGLQRPIFVPAASLDKLLRDETRDRKAIWSFFAKHYANLGKNAPALRTPALQDRHFLQQGEVFQRLLRRMVASWSIQEPDPPSPSDVVHVLESLELMRSHWYLDVIWSLLFRMIRSGFHDPNNDNADVVSALGQEVLHVWASLFKIAVKQDSRDAEYVQEGKIDWSGLPDLRKMNFESRQKIGPAARDIGFRMFRFFENMSLSQRGSLGAAAYTTCDLFNLRHSQPNTLNDDDIDHQPFLRYVIKLLYKADITKTQIFLKKKLEDADIDSSEVNAMVRRLHHAPYRSSISLGIGSLYMFGKEHAPLTPDQQGKLQEFFSTRIGRRAERKEISQLETLWQQAQQAYMTRQSEDSGAPAQSQMPLVLYNNFLFAFADLQRPEKTIEVWNHMIANGVRPTSAQWGCMIRSRSKDPKAMENMWHGMISSGIEPDLQTWNVRIHSLLLWAREAEQGLEALDEMTQNWFTAVKKRHGKNMPELSTIGDLPGAPKPDSFTLTSAISGLVNRWRGMQKRIDLVPRVFRWANSVGVKPNERTYNVLIKMCLEDGNIDEAMKLLGRMEDQGLQPDEATYTIFLDHTFKPRSHFNEPMTVEQQHEAIFTILELFQSRGFKLNSYIFSTLIDGLLKHHGNLPAAQMVLDIMIEHKLEPPPHIWTSFVTHYFQQADDPNGPGIGNLADMDALWNRIRLSNGIVDHIFYDRVIEGYAKCGELGHAMTFLTRMANAHYRPGWPCLSAVMKALIGKGWMDRAAQIVHDVENREGLVRHGIKVEHKRFNPDRDAFWAVVEEAGISRAPGVGEETTRERGEEFEEETAGAHANQ